MNLNLKGKRAVVCGSSQGLGLASAVELSKLGATITLFSRNEESLKRALLQLDTSAGQQHDYLVADFNYPDQVKSVIDQFLTHKKAIHILVNNTGGPKAGNLMDATEEEFLQGFQRHLICNQILSTAMIPLMREAGYGRIINIISISVKQPIPGLGVSNTIRGAVASWAKTLATEVAPMGITVNNVLPGYTRTARYDSLMQEKAAKSGKTMEAIEEEMKATIPLHRIGEPEDFGAAVAFLCSPAAGYITGINLPVDGGRLSCL